MLPSRLSAVGMSAVSVSAVSVSAVPDDLADLLESDGRERRRPARCLGRVGLVEQETGLVVRQVHRAQVAHWRALPGLLLGGQASPPHAAAEGRGIGAREIELDQELAHAPDATHAGTTAKSWITPPFMGGWPPAAGSRAASESERPAWRRHATGGLRPCSP